MGVGSIEDLGVASALPPALPPWTLPWSLAVDTAGTPPPPAPWPALSLDTPPPRPPPRPPPVEWRLPGSLTELTEPPLLLRWTLMYIPLSHGAMACPMPMP